MIMVRFIIDSTFSSSVTVPGEILNPPTASWAVTIQKADIHNNLQKYPLQIIIKPFLY